jgi:hypothetical protein
VILRRAVSAALTIAIESGAAPSAAPKQSGQSILVVTE